jgi:hypothetical protein
MRTIIKFYLCHLEGQSGSGKRKFKGRGHLKGFTASNKRARQGTTKLDVEFSRMQRPVGGNRRSFVDEVVLFTRRKAPLIGVRWWKNIDDEVKEDIADAVMVSIVYVWSIPILIVKYCRN